VGRRRSRHQWSRYAREGKVVDRMRWYGVEVQVGRKVECEVAQKC